MNNDDATLAYADIIHLPRPRSTRHHPMPLADRAAQFASFAALSGHASAIHATELQIIARQNDAEKPVSEEEV